MSELSYLTARQRRILAQAAERARGSYLSSPREVRSARSLEARGLVYVTGAYARVTDAGRRAVEAQPPPPVEP